MRLPYAGIAGAMLVWATCAPGWAQTVSGTLLDETTGRPIPGATVRLLDAAGQPSAVDVTARSGAWVVQAPTAGEYYRVRIERVGYARIETDPFLVGAEPVRLSLATRPEIVVLEGISAQSLNYHALLNRAARRKSARTFLPNELSARVRRLRPRSTGRLVMNMIAALGVTWDDWPVFESVPIMNGQIASRGMSFGSADFRSPWEQASPRSSRQGCNAVVAVDGLPYFKGRPEQILEDLVPLEEVRAVELYPDAGFVPRELQIVSKMNPIDVNPLNPIPCGVVMIWTREGIGVP